uniref:SP1-Sep-1 n=1 Tax=Sepia latimanus TaxID=3248881 RepID=R4FI51_SEPLA
MLSAICCLLVLPLAWASFGVPNKQIVSGENAVACEFPHMVFIDVVLKDGVSFCGATLISKKHVLTAAHCLDGDVTSINAHLGSTVKKDTSTVIAVRQWVKHRGYVIGNSILNDIAMLELTKPVQFTRCIKPIALPKKGEVFSGTCVAAGWGQTGNEGIYPVNMKRADIKIIPTTKCQQRAYGITAQQHVCVGDQRVNGKNICSGDSGGGLVCQRADGSPVVAGVASYVFDCNDGFGVYANTENFLQFIKDYMSVWN